MVRDLTGSMVTQFKGPGVRPAHLVKLSFDGGDLNLWTGVGVLPWQPPGAPASEDWLGGGELLSVETIQETREVTARGARISLAGQSAELVAAALSTNYQNRFAAIWLALFDDAMAVIQDPVQLFSGRMDVMHIEDGETEASLTLTIENVLRSLQRPNERRFTDQDQQERYPGDQGLAFLPSLQSRTLQVVV